jgi:prevent-host-death family protein
MGIHPREGIKPISDFRRASSRILRELREKREPILLTQRGRSVAVLLDIETYERMEYDARLRASYLRGADDLARGRAHSHADVVREMRKGFKE